jgi:putative tricarboxylic transport membrane protein
MMMFGIFGYLCKKFKYDVASLMLAFVLGPMLETNLRQSLLMSKGDFSVFVSRPVSAVFVVVTVLVFIMPFVKKRKAM